MDSISQCFDLMNRKELIENEIKSLVQYLDSQGVGVTGSLIDSEGFPLNSVDLFAIREARFKHNCLQNDLTATMLEIESRLQEIHSLESERRTTIDNAGENLSREGRAVDGSSAFIARHPPFARVDRVEKSSIADSSGLREGDEILQIDEITKESFSGLQAVMQLLRERANRTVLVCVKRGDKRVHLTIVPPSQGPIGCLLVPFQQ